MRDGPVLDAVGDHRGGFPEDLPAASLPNTAVVFSQAAMAPDASEGKKKSKKKKHYWGFTTRHRRHY
jgi:hypothetical protein